MLITITTTTSAAPSRLWHLVTHRAYDAQFVIVVSCWFRNSRWSSHLWCSIRCTSQFECAECEPAARASLANPHVHWPSVGYKDATCQILYRSPQNWLCIRNKEQTHTQTDSVLYM